MVEFGGSATPRPELAGDERRSALRGPTRLLHPWMVTDPTVAELPAVEPAIRPIIAEPSVET